MISGECFRRTRFLRPCLSIVITQSPEEAHRKDRSRASAYEKAVGGRNGVLIQSVERLRHPLQRFGFCEPTLSRHNLASRSCDGSDHRSDAGEQEAKSVPVVV